MPEPQQPQFGYYEKMALWKSLLEGETDAEKKAVIQSWIKDSEEQLERETRSFAELLLDIYEWRWKNGKLDSQQKQSGSNPLGS